MILSSRPQRNSTGMSKLNQRPESDQPAIGCCRKPSIMCFLSWNRGHHTCNPISI